MQFNDFTLTFEQYPLWYIAFCLLLGLLYAVALYFKDTAFKEASAGQRRWLLPLSLFRCLAVSAIAFLLLSPFIKTKKTDEQKPYVIIAADNSESIKNAFKQTDSTQLAQNLQLLADGFADDYLVQTYTFGDELREGLDLNYKDKLTNISESLLKLYDIYDNQTVAGIVLATDGIYNVGTNPVYVSAGDTVPIFAVALGDTTPRRDVIVDKVLHNRIAYLGDKFTIRADLLAKNCKNDNTVLSVYKGDTKLEGKTLSIKNSNFVHTQEFILDANSPGIQQYTISASPITGEASKQNNRQIIYVEVLDSRKKILILGASPHPDLAAIRQSIEVNKNYEVTTAYISNFTQSAKGYDLVILHGLPTANNNASGIIKECEANGISTWFITSSQTSIPELNKAQGIVKINGSGKNQNDAKPEFVNAFSLFTFEGNMLNEMRELPPMQAPFGEYSVSPTAQVMLKQKIGTVSTEYPLLAMEQSPGRKSALLCGEGLWRWRLYDYKKDKEHNVINELCSKVAQYMSVKNDKRKFRVSQAKNLYNENEHITFDAELYNDSYELVNTPEVAITIKDGEGKSFPFVFDKTLNAYALDAGFFQPGDYTYQARTTFTGKEYKANGKFSVASIQLENLQTAANHQVLHGMIQRFGGKVLPPDSIVSIVGEINALNIKPTQYASYQTKAVIDLKWLFFLLLALLALEWFIRKFIGGY